MKHLIAIALVAMATPALAATADGQQASGDQQNPQDRVVCRRVPAQSGSHVSRTRICRTAREWNAAHDYAEDQDSSSSLGVINHTQAGASTAMGATPQ